MVTSLTNDNLTYHHTDGEGRSVRRDIYKQTNGYNTFEKTEYSIYSSVLGKALTDVKSDGAKKKTSVYGAGGQVVATQNAAGTVAQHVAWSNIDPSSASYLPATHTGRPVYLGDDGQAELDPLGSNVQTSNPFDQNRSSNLMQIPGGGGGWGDPFGGYSCMVDWVSQPCSFAAQVLGSGAGDIGPLDQYRRTTYNGKTVFAFFRNYADGYSGYVPQNAKYIGEGVIRPMGPSVPGRLRRNDDDFGRINQSGDSERDLRYTGINNYWDRENSDPRRDRRDRVSDDLLDVLEILLGKALNDGNCKSFMDQYVGGANLLEVFNLARVQRGFAYSQSANKRGAAALALSVVTGGLTDGGGVDFTTNYKGTLIPLDGANLFNVNRAARFLSTLIHELVHISGAGRTDADMENMLKRAGHKMVIPSELAVGDPVMISSLNWNNILQQYCNITPEKILEWLN